MQAPIKPRINLWRMSEIGLILPYPSGVIYSNQTGGVRINHPEEEGVFIPLNGGDGETTSVYKKLFHYFTGPKWGGHCDSGIDEETADFIDGALAYGSPENISSTNYIKVDRQRMALSMEAWIYVTLEHPHPNKSLLFTGDFKNAILTWPNCD